MTLGRLLWLLRRDFSRGFRASWGDHVLRPRIWRWRNPNRNQPPQSATVHILAGAQQLDMTAWMLASWTHHTARNWRIFLHDDGTLPRDAGPRLESLGLIVCVILRTKADAHMSSILAGRPCCAAYRARHPLALKIFDAPAFEKSFHFILLDSDVLFFSRPNEVLHWVDSRDDQTCWFNEDMAEASNVTEAEARGAFGVSLWPRVNSGLCLLQTSCLDTEFCESVLSRTIISSGHPWRVEQTLFALCASRNGKGGLLPPTYQVTLDRHRRPDAISRHYVGAVRDHFYGEGVRELALVLLA